MLEQFTTLKLLEPEWLLYIIPGAAALLLLLITRTFVKLNLLPEEKRRQRRQRAWIFISRLLIVSLIALAMAQPFIEVTRQTQGNPRVTIVADQSGSMNFLDTGFTEELTAGIQKRIPTKVRTAGGETTSDIGSSILQNLEPGGNILLISDGHATTGAALEDVAFYATTLNATLSIINVSAKGSEAAVVISGPGKVVAESDATYTVLVTSTTSTPIPLTVTIDDSVVLDESVTPGSYTFTEKFQAGTHRITATLQTVDRQDNNVHYKTVTVLPKPKILLLATKVSPLELLLKELYDVERKSALPNDLSPYYAVVADDVPIETMRNAQIFHDYLIDESGEFYGNGLVLFGGLDSFDRGSYAGSSLEQFLPVKVGKGQRKKGSANLVFVVDVSGGVTGVKYVQENGEWVEQRDAVPTLDIIKAQVVNAIEQLQIDNRVGVIVFGVEPDVDSGSTDERISSTVQRIAPIDYLYNNRKEITEKIPRIIGGGPTAMDVSLRAATEMLRVQQGDKNVILLTDGRYCAGLGAECPESKQIMNTAANMKKLFGINFMTIGTGTSRSAEFEKKVDEIFLKSLARAGDGTYDRATQLNSLLIKWGDPKAKEFGEEFVLVPLSYTHFITRDIEPTAVMNAYNEVVPKDTAELLIAADSGQPALSTWRYGNGRVATWTVFAGSNMGQLLNAENSLLISRTVNWAIGDPQRKESYFVDITDARINEQGTVKVRSETPVTSELLEFTKQGQFYTATFQPGELGYGSLLGEPYAVNRPREYDRVGVAPELASLAEATGGKVFKPSEVEEIVEHIKQVSTRATQERNVLIWPVLAAALVILLIELYVRRITERRK